jgi:AraC-like DNA-binding protein
MILQVFQMHESAIGVEVPMDMMAVDVLPDQDVEGRERQAQEAHVPCEELADRIAGAARQDGTVEPLQGLHLTRASTPRQTLHSVVDACLCVVAQGSKEVLLGESRYRYDPAHYLLATVELPWTTQVLEASREHPYLSLRLDLDSAVIGAVMVEAGFSAPPGPVDIRAMAVSSLDVRLLDAIVRLVRLLDTLEEAKVLLPLIQREIAYRLLVGEQGSRLRHFATREGYTPQIVRAIGRLRQDFDQPLRVESLARELGMSVSGLHQRFKAVTALSPLQFQKRLRLVEARRLMLAEDLDATQVALRVGYCDASHFNREYKSLFGTPPMCDVHQLRAVASADVNS